MDNNENRLLRRYLDIFMPVCRRFITDNLLWENLLQEYLEQTLEGDSLTLSVGDVSIFAQFFFFLFIFLCLSHE